LGEVACEGFQRGRKSSKIFEPGAYKMSDKKKEPGTPPKKEQGLGGKKRWNQFHFSGGVQGGTKLKKEKKRSGPKKEKKKDPKIIAVAWSWGGGEMVSLGGAIGTPREHTQQQAETPLPKGSTKKRKRKKLGVTKPTFKRAHPDLKGGGPKKTQEQTLRGPKNVG